MRIAWFVPMDRSHVMSGYSSRVCEELIRRGHEVDIFSPVGEQYYDTAVNVILFRESTFDTAQLEQYDHVVYNMGNNVKWHYDIWEIMKRFPGKVIQHDRIMVDFFYMLYHDPEWGGGTAEKLSEYERLTKEFYGSAGCMALDNFFARENAGNEDILNTIMQYSMVSVILHYATGVFTHSGQFVQELKDSFFGPIGHAFLPCPAYDEDAGGLPEPFSQNDGRVLMISTGDVQRLKRVHIVAEVLAENPELAKKVRYVLIGRAHGEYGEALQRLSENELKGCLYLLGFQEDDMMNAFLHEADIAVNLRYPNSEVGSLSLLEQMACKNAVVVLNTGFFAEMPENAVKRISLENEKEELRNALEALIQNAEERKRIAENAQNFAEENCTVSSYADAFLEFLHECADTEAYCGITRQFLRRGNIRLRKLGYTDKLVETGIYDVAQTYDSVLSAGSDHKIWNQNTIGLWFFGQPGRESGKMERWAFLEKFICALLAEKPELMLEVWCEQECEKQVRGLTGTWEDRDRVMIVTRENWADVLNIPRPKRGMPLSSGDKFSSLHKLAARFSHASLLILSDIEDDSAVMTGRPLAIPFAAEDLQRVERKAGYDAIARKVHAGMERMLRYGVQLLTDEATKEKAEKVFRNTGRGQIKAILPEKPEGDWKKAAEKYIKVLDDKRTEQTERLTK